MTLREIDEALAAWKSRVEAAAQNLMDLQAEPTYRRLTGCSGVSQPSICGITAARVRPALAEFVHAFELQDLLRATIERAAALREELPTIFGADQKIREIEELLCGASIRLPAVAVPLAERSLLDGARSEVCLSPAAVLDAMSKTFDKAKDVVMAVDQAWNHLDATLDQTEALIATLHGGSQSLDAAQVSAVDAAALQLADLRGRIKADPLGASTDLDTRIRPVLRGVESAIAARERHRREVQEGLAAARARLESLVTTHAVAVDASAQTRLKIAGVQALPQAAGEQRLNALHDWLERLQKKYDEGVIEPVAVGLRKWTTEIEDCEQLDQRALRASRAPMEVRNELRGRLDALKAKARAHGVAEEDGLAGLARDAQALLHTRPVDLERAGAAVAAYAAALSSGKKP